MRGRGRHRVWDGVREDERHIPQAVTALAASGLRRLYRSGVKYTPLLFDENTVDRTIEQ